MLFLVVSLDVVLEAYAHEEMQRRAHIKEKRKSEGHMESHRIDKGNHPIIVLYVT